MGRVSLTLHVCVCVCLAVCVQPPWHGQVCLVIWLLRLLQQQQQAEIAHCDCCQWFYIVPEHDTSSIWIHNLYSSQFAIHNSQLAVHNSQFTTRWLSCFVQRLWQPSATASALRWQCVGVSRVINTLFASMYGNTHTHTHTHGVWVMRERLSGR